MQFGTWMNLMMKCGYLQLRAQVEPDYSTLSCALTRTMWLATCVLFISVLTLPYLTFYKFLCKHVASIKRGFFRMKAVT